MKLPNSLTTLVTSQSKLQPYLIGAVLVVFSAVGITLYNNTRAASPLISAEPDAGALVGSAQLITDSTASAGRAVQFRGAVTGETLSQIPNPAIPTVETVAYSGMSGDISDDMAIWPNPTDPAKSVVIGANKASSGGGVAIFDMQGNIKQFRKDGYIANIDIRNYKLGGRDVVLVGANDRGNNTIEFWELNPATQQLSAPLSARDLTTSTGADNYGFCFYQSAQSGKLYAFVTPNGGGSVEQWELFDNGGKVDGRSVRTLPISSITESCVADDQLGYVYINQEDVGTWKYGAEPSTGTARTEMTKVGDGRVTADVEGVAIAYGEGSTGYIVMSSQGDNRYAIYDRQTNAFIRNFTVGANGSIDASTGTDGLDITVKNMGPGFEKGVLVVHDESNSGGGTSNLKYVPLK